MKTAVAVGFSRLYKSNSCQIFMPERFYAESKICQGCSGLFSKIGRKIGYENRQLALSCANKRRGHIKSAPFVRNDLRILTESEVLIRHFRNGATDADGCRRRRGRGVEHMHHLRGFHDAEIVR